MDKQIDERVKETLTKQTESLSSANEVDNHKVCELPKAMDYIIELLSSITID